MIAGHKHIYMALETEAAISGSTIVINFAHASFVCLICVPAQASSLVYEAPALGLEAPARETNDPQQKTEKN